MRGRHLGLRGDGATGLSLISNRNIIQKTFHIILMGFSTQSLQGTQLSVGIASCAGCAFMLFGYDQGIFGGLLGNDNFIATFDNPGALIQGQITATYDLGCFFGAIGAMVFGSVLGRVRGLWLGCIVLIVGAVLQASSYSVAQMIVGRFIAGVGNGMNTAVVPVWLSETCKPELRGRLVTLALVLNQMGNVTAQWLNFGLGYIPTQGVSWRFPLAFQCFYALVTVAMLPWLVESPRWLISRGRIDEAQVVISRLYGRSTEDVEVRNFVESITSGLQHEAETSKGSWEDLVSKDRLHSRRRVLLGAGTQFMQQWGGINIINYYLPVVFGTLGLSRRMALILSGCNVIKLMLSSALGAVFIDRYGRVPLMFWGSLAQGVCFVFVAAGLSQGGFEWSAVAVAGVFFYFTAFGTTWIAVPWMYPAEVNTQRMRIAGAGIATATNWICNYAVVLVTPVAVQNIKWKFYIIFAALNFGFAPVVKIFYVETKNLTLEQIDSLFESGPVTTALGSDTTVDEKMASDTQVIENCKGSA
ncbi:hexose carrier protein [Aureobasidium subglaciale]|nr:hexose carrier protein [Aureobasidium subglaciale]